MERRCSLSELASHVSLVFLALCGLLWVVGFRMRLVAALIWVRAVLLLSLQATTLAQLLGFLEELVEVELSDNVLLGMK